MIYLILQIKLDLAFIISVFSRFGSNPYQAQGKTPRKCLEFLGGERMLGEKPAIYTGSGSHDRTRDLSM
jgi:hypothetical protein